MKPNRLVLGTAICLFLSSLHICLAQSPTFTYQGRLSADGAPAAGRYDLRFIVFAVASGGGGGSLVAGPLTNNATTVSEGLFNVSLNFGNDIFDGAERWLEIAVRTNGSTGPFTTLRPRQPITCAPYAVRAANYSGTVKASQVTGTLPTSQLKGTVVDAQLSGNVALVNASQNFNGTNTFNNPANIFSGDGSALTGLSADNLTSGTIAKERLPQNVALLNSPQAFIGDETASPSFRLDGPGTNNWLMLSNGSLWLPPFAQPNEEEGADGSRGGIYFASAGGVVPNPNNNHYILNLVHRGTGRGQLLLSHDNIALE